MPRARVREMEAQVLELEYQVLELEYQVLELEAEVEHLVRTQALDIFNSLNKRLGK